MEHSKQNSAQTKHHHEFIQRMKSTCPRKVLRKAAHLKWMASSSPERNITLISIIPTNVKAKVESQHSPSQGPAQLSQHSRPLNRIHFILYSFPNCFLTLNRLCGFQASAYRLLSFSRVPLQHSIVSLQHSTWQMCLNSMTDLKCHLLTMCPSIPTFLFLSVKSVPLSSYLP